MAKLERFLVNERWGLRKKGTEETIVKPFADMILENGEVLVDEKWGLINMVTGEIIEVPS